MCLVLRLYMPIYSLHVLVGNTAQAHADLMRIAL
jgi:hypothetical protein